MDLATDRHLFVEIGRVIRATRRSVGWTQMHLGTQSGMSQSMVSLIEGGCLPDVTLSTVSRVLDALGVDIRIMTNPPVLRDRERQRDANHARCVAFIRAHLERAGWQTASEVEIGRGRARRWIDVLAFHPGSRLLLVIEVKTEIDDLGEIERVLATYERAARAAARELGWWARDVVGCLLALSTAAVDARVLGNRAAFEIGFPGRRGSLAALIADPINVPRPRGRAFALVDPLSRRAEWLRPSRLDGRRSAAPYADYADFARRLPRSRYRPPRSL